MKTLVSFRLLFLPVWGNYHTIIEKTSVKKDRLCFDRDGLFAGECYLGQVNPVNSLAQRGRFFTGSAAVKSSVFKNGDESIAVLTKECDRVS